jgi:hypothetical protein
VAEFYSETLTNLQRRTPDTSGTIKTFWFCSFQSNTNLIIESSEGIRVKNRLTTVQGSRLPRPVWNPAVETVEEWRNWNEQLKVCFLRIFFYNLFYEFRVFMWTENTFDGLHSVIRLQEETTV